MDDRKRPSTAEVGTWRGQGSSFAQEPSLPHFPFKEKLFRAGERPPLQGHGGREARAESGLVTSGRSLHADDAGVFGGLRRAAKTAAVYNDVRRRWLRSHAPDCQAHSDELTPMGGGQGHTPTGSIS